MVVWSDQVNAKLLITTLQQVTPQVSREVWKKVAETMGSDFTAEACRQNYAKLLKAQGGGSTPAATPGAATTPAPATPKSGRKRKDTTGIEATPSKSASAKKPKKSQIATAALKTEEDEDQEAELVPPATPFVKKLEDDSD